MSNKKTGRAPGDISPEEHAKKSDTRDEPATENYAEHLARVTPDPECSKALLKARYKALHDAEHSGTDTH
jgi:hypothetical protein